MVNEIAKYLKFADVQMAAEADRLANGLTGTALDTVLLWGNNRSSRFTATQATDFSASWTVGASWGQIPS